MVESSLKGLTNHTTQLVQQVQFFLQANGRWAPSPQGQDMQLCQALQSFQQSVVRMSKDNRSKAYTEIQSDFQQLQWQSQNVERLLNQKAQSPVVSAAWMQVRGDLAGINQALYTVLGYNQGDFYDSQSGFSPGMSGSTFQPAIQDPALPPLNSGPLFHHGRYYPGTPYPGMPYYRPTNVNITENSTFDNNPDFQGSFSNYPPHGYVTPGMAAGWTGINSQEDSQVLSNLRTASSQTERFVKQLTAYLQAKGSWPPPAGTPENQLCQNMDNFQMEIRKLGSDLQTNVPYLTLQSEMKHIGAISQNIDQLLMQIGVSSDITGRWNEVRTSMNSTYQAFFSAGSGNGSTRMR